MGPANLFVSIARSLHVSILLTSTPPATVHGSGFRSGPSVALHHGQSVRSTSVRLTVDVSIADDRIEFNRRFPL